MGPGLSVRGSDLEVQVGEQLRDAYNMNSNHGLFRGGLVSAVLLKGTQIPFWLGQLRGRLFTEACSQKPVLPDSLVTHSHQELLPPRYKGHPTFATLT